MKTNVTLDDLLNNFKKVKNLEIKNSNLEQLEDLSWLTFTFESNNNND